MLEQCKKLIASQFEAALLTLEDGIKQCPDEAWDEPVCNVSFCRAAFHGLFWTDLYLGPNPDAVRDQDFHLKHAREFEGYEEWEKGKVTENLYSREFINEYLGHVREKAKSAFEDATEESLFAPSGFDWIKGPVAEVHVYNLRHIQHHAAQLSLRLRLNKQADIPWQRGVWS